MKKAKLSIAALLLLAMVWTMLPVTALAADTANGMAPVVIGEIDGTGKGASANKEATVPTEPQKGATPNAQGQNEANIPMVRSMMPLKEVEKDLDYTGYLPHELRAFPVSQLVQDLGMTETPAVYARYYYRDTETDEWVSKNDNFEKLDANGTINLYEFGNEDSMYVEVIGGTADQLDLNNTRYIATVKVTPEIELFDVALYTLNRQKSQTAAVYGNCEVNETTGYHAWGMSLRTNLDDPMWEYLETDGRYYIALSLNEAFGNDVTVKAVSSTGEDVTGSLFNQMDMTAAGGLLQDRNSDTRDIKFTLQRNGSAETTEISCTYNLRPAYMSLSSQQIYADQENRTYRRNVVYRSSYDYSSYETRTYMLDEGYAANQTYYAGFSMYNPLANGTTNYGIDYVKKAVVGYYTNEAAIPAGVVDIKAQLFSDASETGGYGANYSNGVVFTVIDTDGRVHHFAIKVIPFEESQNDYLSSDTYLRVDGARHGTKDSDDYAPYYDEYYISRDDDDYYINGYQTVFLMNRTYNSGTRAYTYSPVTEQQIRPTFSASSRVSIFASIDGGAAAKQVSGESLVPFTSGKAIQYSASAEDGTNLANYWVTFLTQQSGGPKLFVNAANDPSHYVTEGNTSLPQREIYLNDAHDNKHDVLFANVGDAAMTGLYVKLEDAENVALDSYWTVGKTTTLSAFTTTDEKDPDGNSVYYGDLANVAKVRLVPQTDAGGNVSFGAVSGTLVIGYTGGGTEPVEEVRIKLTGMAGTPKITTTSVMDGVKYVPYSSVIQTNNIYGTDKMAFSVTKGALPDGLSLKPNGEIYGIPTKAGSFTFTITAIYDNNEDVKCERTYTITIKDNTDDNVLATNNDAQGYPLLDKAPNVDIQNFPADGVLFRSEGVFSEFIAFYLDGKKLVDGQDYDASEGSTRIVIQAQTFKNAGNGTHTISAEFRTEGATDGDMHRTSQNVTVTGAGDGNGNGNGSAGGSNGSISGSGNSGAGSSGSNGSISGNSVGNPGGLDAGNSNATISVLNAAAQKIANGDMSYVTEVRTGAVKSALDKGNGIVVSIEQKIISASSVPSGDKTLLNEALGSGGSAGVYMSIAVVIKDATTDEVLGYLSQLPGEVQFTLNVPQSMLSAQKDGKYIYALRIHDGKAEFIDTAIRNGKASFSSDKFSTYALVVVDKKVQGVKTGDPGVMLYIASAAAAAAAGAGLVVAKKRKKED